MSDYDDFISRVKELSLVGSLTGLMGWDQETMMPPKGGKLRSEMMAFLSKQSHSRITDPELGRLLDSLESQDLSAEQAAMSERSDVPMTRPLNSLKSWSKKRLDTSLKHSRFGRRPGPRMISRSSVLL